MTARLTGAPEDAGSPAAGADTVEATDGRSALASTNGVSHRRMALPILVALTLLTCLVGYAEKFPCRDTRNWAGEFQYSRLCYSDVVGLYGPEGLSRGKRPYLDTPVEYPVLIGAAMHLAAQPARLLPKPTPGKQNLRIAVFFDVTAVLLSLAAVVVVACTAGVAGHRRARDALLVALAPALALHVFTNWDMLAVAFATGGLLAWSRRAPRLAGLLLGLGAATKLYPLLLLVPLGLLCLRVGQLRIWWRAARWALAALAVVNLPVYVLAGYFTSTGQPGPGVAAVLRAGGGWRAALAPHHATAVGPATNGVLRFVDLNSHRVADWDSLAFAFQYVAKVFSPAAFAPAHLVFVLAGSIAVAVAAAAARHQRRRLAGVLLVGAGLISLLLVGVPPLLAFTRRHGTLPVGPLDRVTALGFLALLGAIAVLVHAAPRRPRVPQIAFLTVLAFLLTNKVFSPQYVLWVLPLAALARPRWRSILAWQVTEVLVLVTRYSYFAGAGTGNPGGLSLGWFVAAVALRDAALIAFAVLVVRDVLQPDRDDVRRQGADDPAGGVLDGRPDVVRLRA